MDQNASGSGRPLTRRELRALAAEQAAATDQPAAEPQSAEPDEPGAEGVEPGSEAVAAATTTGTTWSDDVRWSLRGELPREVPEEPEEDDVRWDFPEQTIPVGPPEAAPRRTSVWARVPSAASETAAPEAAEPVPVAPEPAPAPQWSVPDELPETPTPPPPPAAPAWTGLDEEPGLPAAPPPATPAPALPPQPSSEAPPAPGDQELPTLSDLLAARPAPPAGPAEQGWQGTVRRITGGLLALRPGPAEQRHRAAVASVQRSLDGPRTVVVINPKGGAHKTTATLLLAATFGQYRGGYTLAWDNNETRGTLGWRARQATHHRTAVDLFADLDRFADPGSARVGDLDNYVRAQGSAQFDVLASDEDAASAASIDDFAFRALHRTLARFYRVMVIDTGNNMRASNWQAAVGAADQVVIVSTVREDTAQSAAWAIDALRATGREDVVRRAVTVLSDPAPRRDPQLTARLHDHFGRLTRAVIDVPYDRSLVGGTPLEPDQLSRRTREAWLRVAAAVAEGL